MRTLPHAGVLAAGLARGPRRALCSALLAGAVWLGRASLALAEDRYELSPYDVSAAGDPYFVAPSASVNGHRAVAAKLVGTYAYAPLLTRVEPNGREHELVGSRLSFDLGGSFALRNRLLFFAGVPLVAHQGGEGPFRPDDAAFADVRLGARAKLGSAGPIEFAGEFRAWLPTGSGDALTGDGTPRGSSSGVMSGRVSRISFSASLGFLARERSALGGAELGPAFPFALAAAFHPVDRLQIGAELWGVPVAGGRRGFFSDRETPLFALLGIRFRAGAWVVGGAAGPGFTEAPGVSPRLMLSVAYERDARPKEKRRDEPAALPTKRAPVSAAPVAPPPPGQPPAAPQLLEEAYPPPPPPRDEQAIRAEAREAFSRGVAAYDEARYEDAVAEFSRAYGLLPHISVLRNLAHSELMSGRMKAACEHFIRWKSEVENPSPTDVKQANEGMRRACR